MTLENRLCIFVLLEFNEKPCVSIAVQIPLD